MSQPTKPSHVFHYAVALFGIFLLLSGGVIGVHQVRNSLLYGCDLDQDYYAARALRQGESLYNSGAYDHPPVVALLLLPFTLVSRDFAVVVWAVASAVVYFGLIYAVGKRLRVAMSWPFVLLVFGISASWYPFIAHIALGQLSLAIAFCLFLGWDELTQGHRFGAGIWFGIAFVLKLYPGVIGIMLLARKRWRSLIGMISATVLITLGSLIFVSPLDYRICLVEIVSQNAEKWALFPINSSVPGVVRRLLVRGAWVEPVFQAPRLASSFALLSVVVILVGHVYSVRRLPATPWGDTVAVAISIIAMLMGSPITWQHAFVLLMLPFGLLALAYSRDRSASEWRLSLIGFALLSLPDVDMARSLMAIAAPGRMPWYHSLLLAYAIPVLSVWWWLLLTLEEEQLGSPPASWRAARVPGSDARMAR